MEPGLLTILHSSGSGRIENDRRERASLRRLEAGELRKRATRLAEALRNDDFELRYLPRLDIDAAGERISAAELWLGLPNRRRGLVPVAPLLRGLDRPVLRNDMLRFALRAAAAEVAHAPPHWQVAVPVPGSVFADGMACDVVLEVLDDMAVAHDRIDLLIDESDLVEGGDVMQQQIITLREHGVCVTLEGFGAVFGCLALLSRLPFSGVKLDRRLAHAIAGDPRAVEAILLRAVVEAARRCDVSVISDGIETEIELRRMREFGISRAQGPWIGPAMPAEAMRSRTREAV